MSEKKNLSEMDIIEEFHTIKFSKPIKFDGKEYKELVMDTDSLTGNDIELAEGQFIAQNPEIAAQSPLKELTKGFQSILAAKSAKVPVELIQSLPAKDYSKVTMKIQTFLLGSE